MDRVDDATAPLLTDLYQLTMAASYFAEGMSRFEASFELFVRRLPRGRRFLVACGLEDAAEFLCSLRFDDAALGRLDGLGLFERSFLDYLADVRFDGDLWAVREGEVIFAGEPLLRVTAPLPVAQLAETYLLNCVLFQTMVASKAARVALACDGRPFADFSGRRDHGSDAALRAARAAFVGGAAATSNVLAGSLWGIPVTGTMAHSYVMAFGDEAAAFRAYGRRFPGQAVFLLDTYDTIAAAHTAVSVARELAAEGIATRGVRLDSGDLVTLSTQVRGILDAAGLDEVQVIASGDLDEHRIAVLLAARAPIDSFGVGTQLGTSADAPSLGGVYKLVEDERGPRMKLSAGKESLPGRKQVWRLERGGLAGGDVIALDGDEVPGGRPLLEPVLASGRRVRPSEALAAARDRRAAAVAALPPVLRQLDGPAARYPITRSPGLRALVEAERERLAIRQAAPVSS